MAVMKCKICGGDLVLEPGSAVAVCEYCGSRQTVPQEKRAYPMDRPRAVLGLEAGESALEKEEWEQAEEIFERILEDDGDNAPACIGKLLAQEKYKSLEDLVTGHLASSEQVCAHPMTLASRESHIAESIRTCSIPGYVEPEELRRLYRCSRSYPSYAFERQKQYLAEEKWWKNNELLVQAEVTATGDFAAMLQSQKERLFSTMQQRLEKAREEDKRAIADMEAAYDEALLDADRQARSLYETGAARREKDYKLLIKQVKKEQNPETLHRLADQLDRLGDYKESRKYSELCRKPKKKNRLETVLFYMIVVLVVFILKKLGLF